MSRGHLHRSMPFQPHSSQVRESVEQREAVAPMDVAGSFDSVAPELYAPGFGHPIRHTCCCCAELRFGCILVVAPSDPKKDTKLISGEQFIFEESSSSDDSDIEDMLFYNDIEQLIIMHVIHEEDGRRTKKR